MQRSPATDKLQTHRDSIAMPPPNLPAANASQSINREDQATPPPHVSRHATASPSALHSVRRNNEGATITAAHAPLPTATWTESRAEMYRAVNRAVDGMRGDPVPAANRSNQAKLSRQLVAWAKRIKLVAAGSEASLARAIKVEAFVLACFHPLPAEHIELLGRLVLWLFLFDDAVGEAQPHVTPTEHAAQLESYLVALREGIDSVYAPTGYHHALVDLQTRARELGGTAAWMDRFPEALRKYFGGCHKEAGLNRQQHTPEMVEYRDLRRRTVGLYPVYTMAELAAGPLNAEEAEEPAIFECQTQASLLAAWINDVYSLPKEIDEGRSLNLLMTLGLTHPTFQSALDAAAQLYDDDLQGFYDTKQALLGKTTSPTVIAHIAMLTPVDSRLWTLPGGSREQRARREIRSRRLTMMAGLNRGAQFYSWRPVGISADGATVVGSRGHLAKYNGSAVVVWQPAKGILTTAGEDFPPGHQP